MQDLNVREMATVAGGLATSDVVEIGVFNIVVARSVELSRPPRLTPRPDPLMPQLVLEEV